MYLHLGQDTVVRMEDVLGVFDLENASISPHTRSFLKNGEKEGRVFNVSYEMPRSFIVCIENGETIVYISQISTATLRKREGFMDGLSGLESMENMNFEDTQLEESEEYHIG